MMRPRKDIRIVGFLRAHKYVRVNVRQEDRKGISLDKSKMTDRVYLQRYRGKTFVFDSLRVTQEPYRQGNNGYKQKVNEIGPFTSKAIFF